MPKGAKGQRIEVYRACRTNQIERESFLNSYEENGWRCSPGAEQDDPGEYSLSTYEKPKDVRRFAITNSEFKPPIKIAKGFTEPECGLSQKTKERTGRRTSHVDWWLYEQALPWKHFELIPDFKKFFEEYKKGVLQ